MEQEPKKQKSAIALREEEVLKFWQENRIFEKSEAKGKGEFIFYDGPPFATGLPHHGHILAGTIKDAIPRYQTMRGKKVFRRWGWDCHGLPLENVIEKELGLKTKKDIEALGVGKFNEAARNAVLRYADDWKRIIPRMGRWADMENAYRTMDATYTESVWWTFKTLYDKGLIYQGFKGMQLCPRCETTLSNFEVAQGYKDIADLAVTVKLELADEPGTFLLAWTTTPWTLPGNMAAAVHPDSTYAKVKKDNEYYFVAEEKVSLFGGEPSVLKKVKGKDLVGKSYKPPFDYYLNSSIQNKENAWKVYAAPYVTATDGTGIVHLAPAYGAEDLDLAIKKQIPIVHHVGVDGLFKKEVTDFAGLHAKPKDDHQSSDIRIIKNLASRGLLFGKEKIIHSYPHCWRCDTPLLNYAATSWFVSVTKIKDKIIRENKKIHWVPEQLGRNRFGKILETAPDWAISRSRYWGAPLPVWQCEQCESRTVIGSFDELSKFQKNSGNNYFVMRHGWAETNERSIVSSEIDASYHLTEKGKKQVEKTIQELKSKSIDLIIHSPILRTTETAHLVAESLDIPSELVIPEKRLLEHNMGSFNGKSVEAYDRFFSVYGERFVKATPNGENLTEIRKRVGEVLFEVERKYQDKNILFITHETPAWIMQSISERMNIENSVESKLSNHFIFETGKLKKIDFKVFPHNDNYEIDVHRPYIDEIVFPCECGSDFKRVPDVFDCWYESGSMPYGQFHYPFDKNNFDPAKKKGYPADFISESVDQTRGWFYSLLVLGVALFDKSPYRNVITNGLVLAEDGQKMSKKLKNYPDPVDVVDTFGADALRYYLISSQLIRGEDLNFSERGLDEIAKKIIIRLENVLSFYNLYKKETKAKPEKSENILDQWILSRLSELGSEVTEGMEKYELDRATRPFLLFIDDLSTWYLRRSRERFKGDDELDRGFALATTRHVLREVSKLIAPFMPFVSEYLFQQLKTAGDAESVHLEKWPKFIKANQKLLTRMEEVRRLVSLGLEARAKVNMKVRQPLRAMYILNKDILKSVELKSLLIDEVNVKEILKNSSKEEVALDSTLTPELKREGLVRDLIREIQDKRKELKLEPKDKIVVEIKMPESKIEGFAKEIGKAVNAVEVSVSENRERIISIKKV